MMMATSIRKARLLFTSTSSPAWSYYYSVNNKNSWRSLETLAFEEIEANNNNKGEKPAYNATVFVLHGLLGSARNWRSFSKNLVSTLATNSPLVDLRNHGRSAELKGLHPPHDLVNAAKDLANLVDSQGWAWPDVVIGHSMGGKKVVYLKRHKKTSSTKQTSDSNIDLEKIQTNGNKSNVFSSVDQHAEERRRRNIEAQKKALAELESKYPKSKLRNSDDDNFDSDYEEDNVAVVEEKKVKKPKVKKIKVIVAEAALKIDASDLSALFLIDVSLWVLDSVPGEVEPEFNDGEVEKVLQTLQSLPSSLPSRKWLVDHMMKLGFSKPFSEWIGSNLKKSGDHETLAFNLDGAVQMFNSYREQSYWSLLEHPPEGLQVAVLRAENSDRWSPSVVQRLESLADNSNGKISVHLLPKSGHWVHVDNPKGLLEIVAPSLKTIQKP
ncbi:hypothetical protein IFM89_030986 [Coptis chinensis]|uniref:AB hydrolase-1 domain-containing protein n=1 Tax=Coptis chinensis TaxID=261450 RepID=A0A835LJY9_9MAGN|nr:hypothetical protein IFM89_030986 [Coptis chinensis]